jgi:hypothetical protein
MKAPSDLLKYSCAYAVVASTLLARGGIDRSPLGHFTAAVAVLVLLILLVLSVFDSVRKHGFFVGMIKNPAFGIFSPTLYF